MQIAPDELGWYEREMRQDFMMNMNIPPDEQLRTVRVLNNVEVSYGSRRSGKTHHLVREMHSALMHMETIHPRDRRSILVYCQNRNMQHNITNMYRYLYRIDLRVSFISDINQVRSCDRDSHIFIDDIESQIGREQDYEILRRFDNLHITSSSPGLAEFLVRMLGHRPIQGRHDRRHIHHHMYESERYMSFSVDNMTPQNHTQLHHHRMDIPTRMDDPISLFGGEPEEPEEPEMNEEDGYMYRLGV